MLSTAALYVYPKTRLLLSDFPFHSLEVVVNALLWLLRAVNGSIWRFIFSFKKTWRSFMNKGCPFFILSLSRPSFSIRMCISSMEKDIKESHLLEYYWVKLFPRLLRRYFLRLIQSAFHHCLFIILMLWYHMTYISVTWYIMGKGVFLPFFSILRMTL